VNGDFPVDLEEVLRSIEEAEVLSIYFPVLRRSLIVDTRTTHESGPLVRVMPMVGSREERVRTIKRMRPFLPRPDSLTVIRWPKYVSSLSRLGVLKALAQRLAATGYVEGLTALREAMQELRRLELDELAHVIRGENYYTIWGRRG
jgi:hypothetical protein